MLLSVFESLVYLNWPIISSAVKYIALGAGDLGFDSRVGKVKHSVVNWSPPLRRFFVMVLPKR